MAWNLDKELEFFRNSIRFVQQAQPLDISFLNTHEKVGERIFVMGQATNGRKFKYKEPYSRKLAPPKGYPKGPRKYYESWADYRKAMGRETAFKNWRFTGRMMIDFLNARKSIGYNGRPEPQLRKRGRNIRFTGFSDIKNAKKMDGQEGQARTEIFTWRKTEIDYFLKTFDFELRRFEDRQRPPQ